MVPVQRGKGQRPEGKQKQGLAEQNTAAINTCSMFVHSYQIFFEAAPLKRCLSVCQQ